MSRSFPRISSASAKFFAFLAACLCSDQVLNLAVKNLFLLLRDDAHHIAESRWISFFIQDTYAFVLVLGFAVELASLTSSKIAEMASAVLKSSSIAASYFATSSIACFLILLLFLLSARLPDTFAIQLFGASPCR